MMWMMMGVAALAADVSVQPGDDLVTLTASLGPGDTILFSAGEYELDESLRLTGLGTAAEPVTFRPATPDSEVVLRRIGGGGYTLEIRDSEHFEVLGLRIEGAEDWQTTEASYGGILVENSSNVTIEGVTMKNLVETGVRINGDTSAVTIRATEIGPLRRGTGINAGCGDASCFFVDGVIEENLIHDLGDPDNRRSAIYLQPGSQNALVQHNVIYNPSDFGISLESTEFGDPNVVQSNAVWNTGGDGIRVSGAARVHNNIVFNTDNRGIRSYRTDTNGLYDVVISYNTVVGTGQEAARLDDWPDADNMVFSSNVLANPIGRGFTYDFEDLETTSNYITNNVVTGFVEGFDPTLWPEWVVEGGGYVDFVDGENWDFFPSGVNAALVDAGDPAAEAWIPETDFNGTPRDGAAPDAGAYEYSSGGNPGWTVQEGFKSLDLNGGGDFSDVSQSGCCKSKSDSSEALLLLPLLGLGVLRRRRTNA